MKKTFKKLMAALLAVALLCAMAVPAFAADAPGSITISNAVSGKTYNVYRILDIATHNDGYTGPVLAITFSSRSPLTLLMVSPATT